MTVLVDEARWQWRGDRWAHLVSDSDFDELHEFATTIGLRRLSFQGDHYDVPSALRERAIAAGAQSVSSRELVARLVRAGLRRRGTGSPWTRLWWLDAPARFDEAALHAACRRLDPWAVGPLQRVVARVGRRAPELRGAGAHGLRRDAGAGLAEAALALDLPPAMEPLLDLGGRAELAEVHLARRDDRVTVELLVRER